MFRVCWSSVGRDPELMEDWQAQEVERIFPDVKAARLTKEVEDLAQAYTHATHMEDDLKEKLAEAEAVCCSLDIS